MSPSAQKITKSRYPDVTMADTVSDPRVGAYIDSLP